jgi:hypothetical protein
MKNKITEFLMTLRPLLGDDEERADAAKIQEIGDAFERETESIFENEDLSSAGKSKRYADLARKTTATTNAWRDGRFAQIDKQIARVQRDVEASANPRGSVPTDPTQALLMRLIDETRAAEIRRNILAKIGPDFDAPALLITYLSGDQETRKALESAPQLAVTNPGGGLRFAPWIPQEAIAEQHMAAAAATNPEAVEGLERLQAARTSVHRFAQLLLTEIAALAPTGPDDPATFVINGEAITVTPSKETGRVGQ